MKRLVYAIILFAFCACGKDKSVLLPEIQNAKITEIFDVSPAYLFYDETQPDSLELNRGNLIITTNWLVNVDKRLTLKQAIPSIKMLQDKKRNSDHKNESARNYYTCNDTSIKNLGFLDFTDVVYHIDSIEKPKVTNKEFFLDSKKLKEYNGPWKVTGCLTREFVTLYFDSNEIVYLKSGFFEESLGKLKKENFQDYLIKLSDVTSAFKCDISIFFNRELNFQDYIFYKNQLDNLKSRMSISTGESIY